MSERQNFVLQDKVILYPTVKKDRLLLSKPTAYGEEVSINLDRREEAHRLIEVFLKKR